MEGGISALVVFIGIKDRVRVTGYAFGRSQEYSCFKE